MAISKKTSEALQNQMVNFLDNAVKRNKLSEKNKDEILHLFQTWDKEFINRLNLKLWKTVDITDEKQIKKKLEKILTKQWYNKLYLENLWKEYEDYLHKESLNKHNREEAEKIFEPYKTTDEKYNENMVWMIFECMEDNNALENLKLILQSGFFSDYMSWFNNYWYYPSSIYFEYLAKHLDEDDLKWIIQNIDKSDIKDICKTNLFEYDNWIKTIRLCFEKFHINHINDIFRYEWDWSGNKLNYLYDILKTNISILEENKYEFEKICWNENILHKDFCEYINLINESWIEDENLLLDCLKYYNEQASDKNKDLVKENICKENILNVILKCELWNIQGLIHQVPSIQYEWNNLWRSPEVNMFWWDWENYNSTKSYCSHVQIGRLGGEEIDILALFWKCYWTKNRKENIDIAHKNKVLKKDKIEDDNPDNYLIAHLKCINQATFKELINALHWINCDWDNIEYIFKTYSINNQSAEKLVDLIGRWVINSRNQLKIQKYGHDKKDTIDALLDNESNYKFIYEFFMNRTPSVQLTLEDFVKMWSEVIKASTENLNIIFEKYPNINVTELSQLDLKEDNRSLDLIFTHYPNISIDELCWMLWYWYEYKNSLFNKYPNVSIQDMIKILKIVKLENVNYVCNYFNSGIPTEKSIQMLNLMKNNPVGWNTVSWEEWNVIQELCDSLNDFSSINNDNWATIALLYSHMEYFEDDTSVPEDIKFAIRELFTVEKVENKNFLYDKFEELLFKALEEKSSLNNEEIALLTVVNKKWLFNMGTTEALAKFVFQINKLEQNYQFKWALVSIKKNVINFLKNHSWDSKESLNSFFQISIELLQYSPWNYHLIVDLLWKLSKDQQKVFYKDIFPLYNVELFLWYWSYHNRLYGSTLNHNLEGQLLPMHKNVRELSKQIENHPENADDLLYKEKDRLVENIKTLFKEKFGIKKIPEVFNNKHIESIKFHSIYLSNMSNKSEDKIAVLWFFLALKLDGKWEEFRAWKDFNPAEYMEPKYVYIIQQYLNKRNELDRISLIEWITEDDKKKLQETEISTIVWNTDGISDRLITIKKNINNLIDPDLYEWEDKVLLKILLANPDLWKILAKKFQSLKWKLSLDEAELNTIKELEQELSIKLDNEATIQQVQNKCKRISPIINFVNNINWVANKKWEVIDIEKEVADFERISKPTEEILRILWKIEIDLSKDWILSNESYISYIESSIKKSETKLSKEEYQQILDYITLVKSELSDLYKIKDRLTELYSNFKEKTIDVAWQWTQVFTAFENMSPYFFTRADVEKENIISLMTNDLNIVIKNIRACLWCTYKWCNNDTDLTFGCNNRFFITTSHKDGDSSFADELVTLLPSDSWYLFVMDKIYWNNWSDDIILNNVLVLLKKIKKLSPDVRKQISIFVPNTTKQSFTEELKQKIIDNSNLNLEIDDFQEVNIHVDEQPISDSYHEFGNYSGRWIWDSKVEWTIIKII